MFVVALQKGLRVTLPAADEIGRESRVAEVFDGKGGAYRARGHDEGQQGDFDDGDHRREDERCARHGAVRGQHDGAGQQLAFCRFFLSSEREEEEKDEDSTEFISAARKLSEAT